MSIRSLNPATGEVEQTFDEFTPKQTASALSDAAGAYGSWRATTFEQRADCLKSLAEVLRGKAGDYAQIMAREMGKPVSVAEGEALKCAAVCDYYAENGEAMLASESTQGSCRTSLVEYTPLGVVLAVMPWNFPFWQVLRIAAPTLMAGNTMVLKHASNVPQCALALEEAFRLSRFPDNVFRTLLIGAGQVESVLDHDAVIGVSLTGSEGAGRKVAAAAGARLKKSVMELGGSDPFIVLDDADMDQAAKIGALSRFGNTGQTCIAAKRFIVLDAVFDTFAEALEREMNALKVGDPLDPQTRIGPMSSTGLRADLQEQVDRCLEAGGVLVCGGKIPEGPGAFYPPSIIRDVPLDADVCREELFGPVALLFRAASVDQAVEIANATPFGLGGSVWTGDESKGLDIARRIEAGAVFVNGLVRSDPALPFGGIKNSGYGRELAAFGIKEFVNIKALCVG